MTVSTTFSEMETGVQAFSTRPPYSGDLGEPRYCSLKPRGIESLVREEMKVQKFEVKVVIISLMKSWLPSNGLGSHIQILDITYGLEINLDL